MTATMKALSLWQPWGSLWLSRYKLHETRDWQLRHRGWLLVHAAKTKNGFRCADDNPEFEDVVDDAFGPHWGIELPLGALIGAVNVVECLATQVAYPGLPPARSYALDDYICGDFTPGRFAFRRNGYKIFRDPIPYAGGQGLFDVPLAVVASALLAAEVRA